MRVNLYQEELTREVQLVEKKVGDRTFIGVRFMLKSSPDLHATPADDDRSAVTFWCGTHQAALVLFDEAIKKLNAAPKSAW